MRDQRERERGKLEGKGRESKKECSLWPSPTTSLLDFLECTVFRKA